MSIKKQIKKTFSKKRDLLELRRFSSKVMFVVSSLVFFTCYYLLALDFKSELILFIFPYVYVSFVTSALLYFYFLFALRCDSTKCRFAMGFVSFLLFSFLVVIFFTDLSQLQGYIEQLQVLLNIK